MALTEAGKRNTVGAVWLETTVTQPFTAEFRYNIGGGSGGDGMVFMFYKNRDYAPGTGGCLGFVAKRGNFLSGYLCQHDDRGYGIEFDGWENNPRDFDGRSQGDPSANHIALIKGTPGNHLVVAHDPRTEDEVWHSVEVRVGVDSVAVKLDGEQVLSWRGVIDREYGGIGLAAANGGMSNWHVIDGVHIRLSR